MRHIDTTALLLIIVGAINWGLVGLFGFNLVAEIFGEMTGATRVIYTLVGAAGLYEAFAVWTLPERWHRSKRERERSPA